MAGGYNTTPSDPLDRLVSEIRNLKDRVSELERPTGTQIFKAVAELTQLVNDLPGQIYAVLAVAVNTGNVNATGDVTANGTVTGAAGVSSVGAYNLDVTALPGGRRTMWVHVSGQFGQTTSTIVRKMNLGEVPFTASDILEISPFVFEYKAQVDIRDNPNNPYYDPEYVVPLDLGLMAEHLVERGMGLFVFFDEDGNPVDINYALFGAVAVLVVGHDHETRLKALEAKVAQ